MVSRDELKLMAGFLNRLPETVGKSMRVVASTGPDDYLYHISQDFELTKLEPRVPRRALENENFSIPRICVAPTVTGCIRGYTKDVADFVNYSSAEKQAGRWALYGIPFRLSVCPAGSLLPDVKTSDERWLVTYDENTVTYEPVLLAKYFYHTVSFTAARKDYPTVEVELYIEVLTQTPIQFSHDVILPQGFWSVRLKNLHGAKRWDRGYEVVTKKISEQFYRDTQTLVASMLSLESFLPPSSKW